MKYLPLHVCALFILSPLLYAEVAGWRIDGTGAFSGTTPPTEWSQQDNVVWRTKLPSWSNACPVPAGERMFMCVEPTTLLAVNTSSGDIEWQSDCSYESITGAQKGSSPEIEALRTQLNEQQKKVAAKRREMRKRTNTPEQKKAIRQEMRNMRKEAQELQKKLQSVDQFSMPACHKTNGYSSATPVTNGKHVFAVYGNGVACGYTVDGKRLWARVVQKPTHGWGHSASPLLVGDTLIVHVIDVFGLDVATGKERWRTKTTATWGSPATARVGDTDLVFLANGDVVRASDGKMLAQGVSKLDYCGPLVDGDMVYYIQNGGKALRLPKTFDEANFKLEEVWTTHPRSDRYYASPVIKDGLIYAIHRNNFFSCIDAKTGEVVYDEKLKLGGGTVFPSICLAGGKVYVNHDNGTTMIVEPGRKFREVRKNNLERFRSTPIFIGSRMYVRGLEHLYCIGK